MGQGHRVKGQGQIHNLVKKNSGCRSRTVCRIEFKLGIHVKYNIGNVLFQGKVYLFTCQGQTRLSVINERFWLKLKYYWLDWNQIWCEDWHWWRLPIDWRSRSLSQRSRSNSWYAEKTIVLVVDHELLEGLISKMGKADESCNSILKLRSQNYGQGKICMSVINECVWL